MLKCSRILNRSLLVLVSLSGLVFSSSLFAAEPIRSQAAIALSFDEASGESLVTSFGKPTKHQAKLINGASRVSSPFWNQNGKRALLLDAGKKQSVLLSNVPYLDRPDAVSLSFFFLSLHDLNDTAAHGIVAKRAVEDRGTNYGINFAPKADLFQVYLNDGSGFKIVEFSASGVLGSRRLVHVTATLQVADAPGPDADSDKDDVLVRLFVNGQPVKPKKVTQGNVAGNDAWLTDINSATILNDVPLTLGSSFPDGEHTSGLLDEFLLFPRALSAQEALALFTELAGPKGAELAKRELNPQSQPPSPQITTLSLHGLQIAGTTNLTISGSNLGNNPRVVVPGVPLQQTSVKGSNSGQYNVNVSIPVGTKSGFYPLRVQTDLGLSNPIPVAIDSLPQRSLQTGSREPSQLPAAFSGVLSGSQQARIYFQGKTGQRVVADVEARRLGANMEPVIEIKTEQGTPLLIEWGKVHLKGDSRGVVTLPLDGLYFVELHDLAYKAPGRNVFRLKVGDLSLVDTWFPPAVASGATVAVEPVGIGIPSGTKVAADLFDRSATLATRMTLPDALKASGPSPALLLSDGTEVVEREKNDKTLQTVDATFSANKNTPLFINGRISAENERDRFLLNVTPGQKLNLSVAARSINSPLDAELSILSHPQGAELAVREDRPGSRDPSLDYTVPAGVKQIQVAIRDLHGNGGAYYLYRLQVTSSERADFDLKITSSQTSLPAGGRVVLKAQLNRTRYSGPINLSVVGNPSVSISPAQLPAEQGNRSVLLTLNHHGSGGVGHLSHLKIVAESTGLTPSIRRVASVVPPSGLMTPEGFRDHLPLAVLNPAGLSLDVGKLPPVLFKGIDANIDLALLKKTPGSTNSVRLTLLSTEAPRRVVPNDPKKGNKPLVRAVSDQVVSSASKSPRLKLTVPQDVAQSSIDFVVRADLIPHLYSRHVLTTFYSKPFRISVQTPATVTLDPKSFNLLPGQTGKIRGTIKRTSGFKSAVNLSLAGLPAGFSSPKVTVPGDQGKFELSVTVPAGAKPQALPKISIAISAIAAGTILPSQPVALKVVASKK